MGNLISLDGADPLGARELLKLQQLAELKQKKRERDITQSMQVALTRDRILWLGGYYASLGVLA